MTKEEEIYYIMYEKLNDIIDNWIDKNCYDRCSSPSFLQSLANLNDGLWFCRGCGAWNPWKYSNDCELLPHWFKHE